MNKKEDNIEIHIHNIIKKLIIPFVAVTILWGFFSFSSSDEIMLAPPRTAAAVSANPAHVLRGLEKDAPGSPLSRQGSLLPGEADLSPPGVKAAVRNLSASFSKAKAKRVLPNKPPRASSTSPGDSPPRDQRGSAASDDPSLRLLSSSTTSTDKSGSYTDIPRRSGGASRDSEGASSYEDPSAKEARDVIDPVFVCSLYGGGYRGQLQFNFFQQFNQQYGIDLRERGTVFAGTSVGGFNILSFLAQGSTPNTYKYSWADVEDAYKRNGDIIFKRSWWQTHKPLKGILSTIYQNKHLLGVLKSTFEETKFSEIGRKDQFLVIPARDMRRSKSVYYFKSTLARQNVTDDYLAWQVGAATTAAPVYFGDVEIKSLTGERRVMRDGGTFKNNPVYRGYLEAKIALGVPDKDLVVASLGTGIPHTFIPAAAAQGQGLMHIGVRGLFNTSLHSSDEDSEDTMRQTAEGFGFPYHSFNPLLLLERTRLDLHDEDQQEYLKREALRLFEDGRTDKMAEDLRRGERSKKGVIDVVYKNRRKND